MQKRIWEIGFIVFQVAAVCLAATWAVLGWLAARWVLRSAHEPSPQLIATYESIAGPTRNFTRLRVSSRLNRPVLIGVIRPTIVLPATLVESGDQERLRQRWPPGTWRARWPSQ